MVNLKYMCWGFSGWCNRVRTGLTRCSRISQGEEIGQADGRETIWRPVDERNGRDTRTVLQWPDTQQQPIGNWSSTDSWMGIRVHRNSGGKPSHQTAGPADLFNLTKSRHRVAKLKQLGMGTVWISWSRPSAMPHQVPFCEMRQTLLRSNNSKLCVW